MGEKVANLIKRKNHKNESNAQTSHSCTIIHCMTHCINYMFPSEKIIQKKEVLYPIKASEIPLGRKKKIQTDQIFQRIPNRNPSGSRR